MRHRFRTHDKHAGRARAEAARRGREDGRRRHPQPGPLPEAGAGPSAEVSDTFAAAQRAEAVTASALAAAGHLERRRPRDDAAVDRAVGAALRLTGEAAERRQDYGVAVHELAAFESRAPLAARARFWPGWVRLLLIVAMAVCGGANLAAGLLAVTSDDPAYALTYAAAIGVALVGLGAAVGHMLRRWELNGQRPHEHVARGSRVPAAVVALGLVFAVGLVAAVASIRATGAIVEARSWAVDDVVEVFLPDEAGTPAGGASAAGTDEAAPPTIPPLAWGVLEGVLVTGALLVEYVGYLPWAARHAELQRRARRRRRAWERRRAKLARAVTRLASAWDARADRDAAILLLGEATWAHAAVEVAVYRGENLAARGADDQVVFGGEDAPAPPRGGMHGVVGDRWGGDLRDSGGDRLVADALAGAVAELRSQDVRPGVEPVAWDPARLYEAELRGHRRDPLGHHARDGDRHAGHDRPGGSSAAAGPLVGAHNGAPRRPPGGRATALDPEAAS